MLADELDYVIRCRHAPRSAHTGGRCREHGGGGGANGGGGEGSRLRRSASLRG